MSTKPAIPYLPHSNTRGYFTRIAKLTRKTCKGYSRQHVSGVLRGVKGYSDTSLREIAKACKVDVGWLAGYIEHVKDK